MTPDQLRAWQASCGFRRDADAAAELGVHVSTYRRYLAGRSPIPPTVARLADYIAYDGDRILAMVGAFAELERRFVRVISNRKPAAPAKSAEIRRSLEKVRGPLTYRR